MLYQFLATAAAVLHFAFILFVVLGGLLVLRWPKVAFFHLPAATWGVLIEFAGWYCPLTRWENYFLREAGKAGYSDGFIAHYIFALIYPDGLTRGIELAIGGFVLAVNLTVYARLLFMERKQTTS
ncbi:MAG TPA: DUF2784 domain-containing protein [Thermoanaerobaculia bacterium]